MSASDKIALTDILSTLCAQAHTPKAESLHGLVAFILNTPDEQANRARFNELNQALQKNDNLKRSFATYLINLLAQYKQVACLTDMGMVDDDGFFDQLKRRSFEHILPKVKSKTSLYDLIDTIFGQQLATRFINHISVESASTLFSILLTAETFPVEQIDAPAQKQVGDEQAQERLDPNNSKHVIWQNIQQAVMILSYRLSGIGLHKELINTYPDALNYHSAFIAQNIEVGKFIHKLSKLKDKPATSETTQNTYQTTQSELQINDDKNKNALHQDARHILVMLEQCLDIVQKIRKQIFKTGLTIRLSSMLLQIEKLILRLSLLVRMLDDYLLNNKTEKQNAKNKDKLNKTNSTDENYAKDSKNEKIGQTALDETSKEASKSIEPSLHSKNKLPLDTNALYTLTVSLLTSTHNRNSLKHVVDENTYLLSKKIIDNASKHGEKYISTDVSGYRAMFKKAAIGGFLIAIMALLKITAGSLELAPFGKAFVNSMIYGLGFVIIFLIGGTVATKQPAMTAAAIASTIDQGKNKRGIKLGSLAELIVDIMRTQFIAIMGNIMIAMPLALIISLAWVQFMQPELIGFAKADYLLAELNPFTSLALFHAGIAGIYLFFSGLISGYYDNKAVYNNLGARIANQPWLTRVLSESKRQRLGQYIEMRLGSIMGNFLFGVMLGSTATLGYVFGLPIDIRHIAFASANMVYGLLHIESHDITVGLIIISMLGVTLIGFINLMVSFTLALLLALRAKQVKFSQWQELFVLVLTHLIKHPQDFFIPRREPVTYARLDNQGKLLAEKTNRDNN